MISDIDTTISAFETNDFVAKFQFNDAGVVENISTKALKQRQNRISCFWCRNAWLSVLAIAVSIVSGKIKDLVGASCNQCSVIKSSTASLFAIIFVSY